LHLRVEVLKGIVYCLGHKVEFVVVVIVATRDKREGYGKEE
jgi:hypothetical protein